MTNQRSIAAVISAIALPALLVACAQTGSDGETKVLSQTSSHTATATDHGAYLVKVGGCNDCHTPKNMTPEGPVPNMTLALSGHPSGSKLPPLNAQTFQPGNWVLLSPDMTSAAGPWGVSYAANITSDSITGIGSWTAENFVNAMRKGKHLGLDNARPIMPPMPWQSLAQLSDDDLKAIFAYLKTVPPVHNRVPEPLPPVAATVAKLK